MDHQRIVHIGNQGGRLFRQRHPRIQGRFTDLVFDQAQFCFRRGPEHLAAPGQQPFAFLPDTINVCRREQDVTGRHNPDLAGRDNGFLGAGIEKADGINLIIKEFHPDRLVIVD